MTKEAELEVKQSRVLLGDSLHVFNHNYSKNHVCILNCRVAEEEV